MAEPTYTPTSHVNDEFEDTSWCCMRAACVRMIDRLRRAEVAVEAARHIITHPRWDRCSCPGPERVSGPTPMNNPSHVDRHRLYATTDASVWAEEFYKVCPEVDEGLMIGWFANAIETAKAHERHVLGLDEPDAMRWAPDGEVSDEDA